jgi:hypothetical protein
VALTAGTSVIDEVESALLVEASTPAAEKGGKMVMAVPGITVVMVTIAVPEATAGVPAVDGESALFVGTAMPAVEKAGRMPMHVRAKRVVMATTVVYSSTAGTPAISEVEGARLVGRTRLAAEQVGMMVMAVTGGMAALGFIAVTD